MAGVRDRGPHRRSRQYVEQSERVNASQRNALGGRNRDSMRIQAGSGTASRMAEFARGALLVFLSHSGMYSGFKRLLTGAFLVIGWCAAGSLSAAQPAIASAHPLATRAGLDILRQGGNAFDAAVAVSAVLAVVEPQSSGLGGGGFWLLHRARDGRDIMIDGREKAPLAAHRDMFLDEQGKVIEGASIDGPLAAGIPGEPAALVHIARRYGKLPLRQTLAPAIALARKGFLVDAHFQRLAAFRRQALARFGDGGTIFLRAGEAPAPGSRIVQADLAATLEKLATEGRDGFYQGAIARALVSAVRDAGGVWTERDLASYRVVERKPLSGVYRGMRITTAALPSSGGIVLLEILNQLAELAHISHRGTTETGQCGALAGVHSVERLDVVSTTPTQPLVANSSHHTTLSGLAMRPCEKSGLGLEGRSEAAIVHLIVESMRRAYRDRAEFLGDDDFVYVPVARLLSRAYGRRLAASISLQRATPSVSLSPAPGPTSIGRDTTHFSIVDAEGNRVAATLSINYPFGSGFVAPGTGVLLNDEMDDFSIKPGTPDVYGLVGGSANAIEPGKRMLSSMTPTFLEKGDRVAVVGTPGGSRIITMVLLSALAFERGASAGEMVALRRFHHQYLPDWIEAEAGAFSESARQQLEAMGHHVKPFKWTPGNMQVVIVDKRTGRAQAAADPRGGGAAAVADWSGL